MTESDLIKFSIQLLVFYEIHCRIRHRVHQEAGYDEWRHQPL